MPKNAVTDWDTTAALNTDIGGINIDEGCPARNINNAIRESMKQIASAHTAYAWTILDDANAGAARTTLELGTIATQAANNVSITGGAISGITDLAVADGGTGASTAGDARTNLGLVIGTDVQAYDAQLSSLIRQNSQSDAYTLVLTDGGKHIFHPSADTSARTWTIPANASVAFAVGTAVTFINQHDAGVITIAITSDTMRLAGAGTTGDRTLVANVVATAVKVTSTEWIISGTGLS